MQRALEIDCLKYVLACMVVGLHCQFLAEVNAGVSYVLVNGVFRIAVPCFFVLSGYFFKPLHYVRTIKRIAALYGIWMFIYLPFWAFDLPYDMRPAAPLWQDIFYGYYHLWFLVALMLGLSLYHLLQRYCQPLVIPCVVLTGCTGIILQYGHNYGLFKIAIPYYCNAVFFAYPFIALGVFIRQYQWHQMKWTGVIALCTFCLVLAESYINYEMLYLQGVRRPFDVLASLYLFCPALCAYVIRVASRSSSGVIGSISLYMYLLHPLVIIGIWQVMTLSVTPLTLLTIIVSTIGSALIIYAKRGYLLIRQS